MEKDIKDYIDKYMEATILRNEPELDRLEEEGSKHMATYADVANAITNLTLGVNQHVTQIEENQQFNLNVLIDALYKAELINDDVVGYIQETLEKADNENKEDNEGEEE